MINKTNINKVLNKLPKDKVELEKVELAKVSDLVKLYDKIKKSGDSVESDIDKVISTLDGKIRSKIKEVLKDVQKSE